MTQLRIARVSAEGSTHCELSWDVDNDHVAVNANLLAQWLVFLCFFHALVN